MKYAAFTALIVITAITIAALPSGTRAGPGGPDLPIVEQGVVKGPAEKQSGEITVRFKAWVPGFVQRRLTAASGASLVDRGSRSHVVRMKVPGSNADKLLAALRSNPLVAEAGPSRNAGIVSRPDDPMYPYQWNLRSAAGGSWADTAWDMATNHGAGVTVAIIDTGVAYEDNNGTLGGYPQTFHRAPDLAAATFVVPWDFVNNDAHPNDDQGHGTHVAGTIAENTNNGYGMAGVAYAATIMPVKALDYQGGGTDADVVESIYYAVDHGAGIISMSLGFPGTGLADANGNVCTEIVGLGASLQYAYDHGVVVVAAAGNDGGSSPLCPAAFPTVISVGATRYDGGISSYSNRGAQISAPGGEPSLDQNGDGFGDGILQETFCYDGLIMLWLNRYDAFCNVYYSGTSMATPHVAGTAALLLGEDPSLTIDQVRDLLYSTARDNGTPGFDSTYGWGNLDAAAAVGSLLGVVVPQPTPMAGLDAPTNVTAAAVSSSRIDITWADNATAEAGYKLERSTDGVNFTLLASLPANRTSYSNTNLPASTTYYYRVMAYNGPDSSAYGGPVSATTQPAPAAPSGLTATALSSSKIRLNWVDNATNEAGFWIERSTNGQLFSAIAIVGANSTSFALTNLPASTTYWFRVRAYEGPNYSAYSNTASATTQAAPAAPTNLTATAVSSALVNLAWTDNATNEAGFKVERSTDGVNFTQVATPVANATTYASTGLAPGTAYTFRVRAYDGPNNSAYSNVASATTQVAPAAPTNLTATAVSSSRIDLAWTDNATNEAGFKVERSTDGVNFSQIATLVANTTTYASTGLAGGTAYTFRVRAYDGTNYSAYSNTASATTAPSPGAPTNLSAAALSSSRIQLAWTDNSSNEAGFWIERSTNGSTFSPIAIAGVNATSYTVTNLTSSTTYWFRVRAYESTNYSAYTNVAQATTQPAPPAPTNLAAAANGLGKITMTWTDNASNEAGFWIERSTDGVTFTSVALVGVNTTTFNNAGLTSGTTYFFRIRAYDGPNYSAYSNVASATAP